MSMSSVSSNSAMQQQMQVQRPTASQFTTEIMENSDLDGDSLLSIEEIGLSEEDFSSFDTDEDGFLSSEEVEETLSSKMDSIKDNELTLESFAAILSDMGVDVPESGAQQGPPPGGGGGEVASDTEEEEYDEADTNEDGVVTDAEQAAYDGTTLTQTEEYAQKLVGSLIDALKQESSGADESLDLSKFKSVMSMINNETQEANTANKLNTYVSNLDLGLKTA